MWRWMLMLALALVGAAAQARGLQFAEEMRGVAWLDGEYRSARVQLKVVIPDIDAWRANPAAVASVSGMLFLDRLPAQPMAGTLAILAPAPGDDGRLLTYRLQGGGVQFTGVKHVRDHAPAELLDAMTTLRGVFQPRGASVPAVEALMYDAAWTSQLHFEWWNPSVVWSFSQSFSTIATPWYQELEVRAVFLRTVLGALASTVFPWL